MKFLFVLLSIFIIMAAIAMRSTQAIESSDDVCQLPKEIGPCRKSDQAFYHNTENKQCEEFIYGGCMGNGNRFETKEECEQKCSKK